MTFGLGTSEIPESTAGVRSDRGQSGGRFREAARELLVRIEEGQPVSRREAVRLARMVLEADAVRAAEAVLEADDAHLVARVTHLLSLLLVPPTPDERVVRRR